MQIGIVQFPGSNCERETILAVQRACMQAVEFLWNEPLDKLRQMDGFVIVGGFSYEDRSRAGIIAALDPVISELKAQSELGKPILGICNGAQILVESGLVPGLENQKLALVLAENKRMKNNQLLGQGFYNAWVHMRLSDQYQRNAFTRHLNLQSILKIPVAHAEGRFLMTPALWEEISVQGLAVFQYCDATGKIDEHFPVNPNGSMHNIAALANKAGNVMAMMPHPERTTVGDPIFQSMRDYITEGFRPSTPSLYYYPRSSAIPRYKKASAHRECIIELLITDNQALSVQNALNRLGFPVKVKRFQHWEIKCDSDADYNALKTSGLLYNDRKEVEVQQSFNAAYLVRAKEDLHAKEKLQTIKNHFEFNIDDLHYGVLWQFSSEQADIKAILPDILKTNIIHNPFGHDCYEY